MNLEGLRVRYSGEHKFVTYNGCPTLNGEGEIVDRRKGIIEKMFITEGHVQMRGLVMGVHMWDIGDMRVYAWEGDRYDNKKPITVFYETYSRLDDPASGTRKPEHETNRPDLTLVPKSPIPISRGMELREIKKAQ